MKIEGKTTILALGTNHIFVEKQLEKLKIILYK